MNESIQNKLSDFSLNAVQKFINVLSADNGEQNVYPF